MTTLQSLTCAVLTDTGGVLQSSWKVRAGPTARSTQSSTGNTPSPSPTGETEAGGAHSRVHLMPRTDPSLPSAGPSKERQLCDTLKPKQRLKEAGRCRCCSSPDQGPTHCLSCAAPACALRAKVVSLLFRHHARLTPCGWKSLPFHKPC